MESVFYELVYRIFGALAARPVPQVDVDDYPMQFRRILFNLPQQRHGDYRLDEVLRIETPLVVGRRIGHGLVGRLVVIHKLKLWPDLPFWDPSSR